MSISFILKGIESVCVTQPRHKQHCSFILKGIESEVFL